MTGGGADARALAAKVSEAWIHFARTGNPNHAGITHWAEFTPETVPTLIFDNKTEAVKNPDGGEQASIAEERVFDSQRGVDSGTIAALRGIPRVTDKAEVTPNWGWGSIVHYPTRTL